MMMNACFVTFFLIESTLLWPPSALGSALGSVPPLPLDFMLTDYKHLDVDRLKKAIFPGRQSRRADSNPDEGTL